MRECEHKHTGVRPKYKNGGPLVCRGCEAERHKFYRLRKKTAETLCRNGHPRTEENIRWTKERVERRSKLGEWRPICRICERNYKAANVLENLERGTLLEPGPPWTWRNAYWADGPKLVEWILAKRLLPERSDDATYKRLQRWREGELANVLTVDNLLIKHRVHLSETPDEIWVEGHDYRAVPTGSDTELLRDGEWLREQYKTQTAAGIARIVGCDPRTVRYALKKHNINRHGQKPHCHNGHPYTEESTYYKQGGGRRWRACKICRREAQDRSNKRRRERRKERTPTRP